MSHPSPGLLDPLDGWPRIDPNPGYVRAAISDLDLRAARWSDARDQVIGAGQGLTNGSSAALDAARLRTDELALAITGFVGPLEEVAGVLEAYLLAYERYEEEFAIARAVAQDAVREAIDTRRHNGAPDVTVALTPLRQRAWDLATAALEAFSDAGQHAAVLVEAVTQMISGGWVDTGTACRQTSLLGMLIGGGEAQSAVRGAGAGVRTGFQLLVMQRKGLLTAEDVQRVRKKLTVGGTTLTSDDGRLRAIAGAVATRAGVGQGTFAILGVASGLAQAGLIVAGDVVTVVGGSGESGAHAAITRASAAANGIAGAQLAVEAFEMVGVRALSTIALPVFIATSAYQLGDLIYVHRKRIGATLESFAGHRVAERLP